MCVCVWNSLPRNAGEDRSHRAPEPHSHEAVGAGRPQSQPGQGSAGSTRWASAELPPRRQLAGLRAGSSPPSLPRGGPRSRPAGGGARAEPEEGGPRDGQVSPPSARSRPLPTLPPPGRARPSPRARQQLEPRRVARAPRAPQPGRDVPGGRAGSASGTVYSEVVPQVTCCPPPRKSAEQRSAALDGWRRKGGGGQAVSCRRPVRGSPPVTRQGRAAPAGPLPVRAAGTGRKASLGRKPGVEPESSWPPFGQ